MAVDDARNDVVLKTMAFTLVGDLLLLCHSRIAPSDDEWNRWVERGRATDHRGVLALTEGGAPNSAQRARTADAVNHRSDTPPPFALLTDSTFMRSVMTAFTWLLSGKQQMRALAPTALDEALTWLGVEVRPERVREAIARLQAALVRAEAVKSKR